MPSERRRSKRYRLDLVARFRIYLPSSPETSSSSLSARIYDLSESGMRLLTNQVQSEGLHILHPDAATSVQCHLEIEMPESDPTLKLCGKVIWYDRTSEENPLAFQVGIEFLDLTKEMRKEIQQVIHRALATS